MLRIGVCSLTVGLRLIFLDRNLLFNTRLRCLLGDLFDGDNELRELDKRVEDGVSARGDRRLGRGLLRHLKACC